jgi:hypothetical protein
VAAGELASARRVGGGADRDDQVSHARLPGAADDGVDVGGEVVVFEVNVRIGEEVVRLHPIAAGARPAGGRSAKAGARRNAESSAAGR